MQNKKLLRSRWTAEFTVLSFTSCLWSGSEPACVWMLHSYIVQFALKFSVTNKKIILWLFFVFFSRLEGLLPKTAKWILM